MGSQYCVRTEFAVGERARLDKVVSQDDILSFARITGDHNPVHSDPEFAGKTRFRGPIAHGMFSAGLISAVLGTMLPGPGSIYLSQSLRFLRPVRAGDKLTAEVEVTEWNSAKRTIRLNTRCFNAAGDDVVTGEALLLVEPLQ